MPHPLKFTLQGWAKVGLQLRVHKTTKFLLVSLFSNYLLFSIRITLNLLLSHPVFIASDHFQEWRTAGESWGWPHSCVTLLTFSESHRSSFHEEVGGTRCFANCPSPSSHTWGPALSTAGNSEWWKKLTRMNEVSLSGRKCHSKSGTEGRFYNLESNNSGACFLHCASVDNSLNEGQVSEWSLPQWLTASVIQRSEASEKWIILRLHKSN